MLEEHNKRFRFTFQFQFIHPERERRPLPTRRPTEREIINDFPPRRQPPRERGLASFPRGPRRERESPFRLRATERDDPVSSATHGERDYRRQLEEPRRKRESPSRKGRWRDFERKREWTKENRRRSSSLLSLCLHVSLKYGFYLTPIKRRL